MRTIFGVWVLASLCWIAGVAYACVQAWPHLSLDLSPTDAGTLSAYDSAVVWHCFGYGAVGLLVPLVVLVVGRVALRT